MYLLPLLEVTGKRPVRSVAILLDRLSSMHLMMTWCVLTCGTGDGFAAGVLDGVGAGVVVGCVLRTFLRVILRWSFAVVIDFGRCLVMRLGVSPGHVVKNFFLIPLRIVSTMGGHAHMCR